MFWQLLYCRSSRAPIDLTLACQVWPSFHRLLLDRICLRARIPVERIPTCYRSRPHAVGGVDGGLAALGAWATFGDNRRSLQ